MIEMSLSEREIDSEILRYSNVINKDTGFHWWKRYTYSAFWSITANPINLSITIFTALTTGESATGSLFGESITTSIGLLTLVLSIINTFFKPYDQLRTNQSLKEKWSDRGVEYEELYHQVVHNIDDKKIKLQKFQELYSNISVLKKNNESNYIIDLIFTIARVICIRKDVKWIPEASEEYKREMEKINSLRIDARTVSETTV
jgi:hypothetical protein